MPINNEPNCNLAGWLVLLNPNVMQIDFLEKLESTYGVAATEVTGSDFRTHFKRCLERFFPNVKRHTGSWVHQGLWWHAYSFQHEAALTGLAAFEQYRSMPIEPFFLFRQWDDRLFKCTASSWPDLRDLEDDLYLFPHHMAWMFLTTHEMSRGHGPYFARPPKS